jgi:signal transduction histidine kinase
VLRNRLFRTSSFRLALLYAGLTGISFLVLFGVIFWSTARFMRHQIDDSVSSELGEILSDSAAGTPAGAADDRSIRTAARLKFLVQGLTRHSAGFYYLLQDSAGVVQAGNLPAVDSVVGIREWPVAADPSTAPLSAIRGRGMLVAGNYLFVGWGTHQLLDMEDMVARSFLWGLAASLALGVAGGAVMSGRLLRKVESIGDTSRDIIGGDLRRRVAVTGTGDEFDNLAGSINTMLDRIETLMDDLRQVTTNIAHDLRTPLTRLRQRLELSQRSGGDAGDMRESLAATVVEIDAILGIFAALLRIAQIESGARKSGFQPVQLNELLLATLELYRPAIEERNQTLAESIESGLSVRGDRELLMQLFANLIENAIRHAPPGANLQVMAAKSGARVLVSVTDDGPGIAADMRDKVLQRFVRLDGSRASSGYGLGLSLAAAIVKLHDADMMLTDNAPGLRVTVSLAALA